MSPLVAGLVLQSTPFEVRDGGFYKGDAKFVPIGVNASGQNWLWPRNPKVDADLLASKWKLNIVRLNCRLTKGINPDLEDVEPIVNALTSRGLVVVLELHDATGDFFADPGRDWNGRKLPDLAAAKAWWFDTARKFAANGNVWFNLANEPGHSFPVDPLWRSMHLDLISVIRDSAKAGNVVLLDGNYWASEDDGQGKAVAESSSAILTYGEEIARRYKNVAYGFHVYHSWAGPEGGARLTDFLERCKRKNLTLLLGEYAQNGPGGDCRPTAGRALEACRRRGIGRLAWHWSPEDGNNLTTPSATSTGGGWAIEPRDGSKPTNLSWLGDQLWTDAHEGK